MKIEMTSQVLKKSFLLFTILLIFSGCNGKFPGADARKFPDDPALRVKKNLEEGRGFKMNDVFSNKQRGGTFDFANSNELWRASLDVIDFMPLASANYSGGMIITDWYSDNTNSDESIKLIIRFLSNEVRSDAIRIKIFYRVCDKNNSCVINEKSGPLAKELKKEILKIAAKYKTETKEEEFEEYVGFDRQK